MITLADTSETRTRISMKKQDVGDQVRNDLQQQVAASVIYPKINIHVGNPGIFPRMSPDDYSEPEVVRVVLVGFTRLGREGAVSW